MTPPLQTVPPLSRCCLMEAEEGVMAASPHNEVRIRVAGRDYTWKAGDDPRDLLPAIALLNHVYDEATSSAAVALDCSKPIVTDSPDLTFTKPK